MSDNENTTLPPNDPAHEELLKNIVTEKDKANKMINSNIPNALEIYHTLRERLNAVLDHYSGEETAVIKELKSQRVLIVSNVSLCFLRSSELKKSAETDEHILNELDPKFAKSCARLIDTYMKLENENPTQELEYLKKANETANKFRQFNEETRKKNNNEILKVLEGMNYEKNFNGYKDYVDKQRAEFTKSKNKGSSSYLTSLLVLLVIGGILYYFFVLKKQIPGVTSQQQEDPYTTDGNPTDL